MKRSAIWIVSGVTVIISMATTGCSDKQETVQPRFMKLTSAVYASGTLLPEEEYTVMSAVDGYLQEAYVKEGDTVRKGQALFYITSEVRQAQEQGASALVQRTLPTVAENAPVFRELQGRMELARIKMEQDELQYNRYKRLYEEDAVSKTAYEKYYLQYQASQKDYQNLKQQYEQQTLSGRVQLQQAQNQLQLSLAQQNIGKLKSFADGVVYDIFKDEGDLVNANQRIALIGSGDMVARLSVDEDDLGKVYPGQPVLITMDAYDDKVFKASIKKVYPVLNKVEQSFRVDAMFDEALPVGIYGLNLEANIVLAENKEVMVIPRKALVKGDSVWISKDGKETMVPVQTGIADDEWVEIKGGIDKSTTVIIK